MKCGLNGLNAFRKTCMHKSRCRGKGRGRGSGMWHVYIKIWIDCLIRFFNLDFSDYAHFYFDN
ncbi:hypothetical protein ACS0TY_020447 [Phlomoides rotata]